MLTGTISLPRSVPLRGFRVRSQAATHHSSSSKREWNRPKRIILIRHGESEGNADEEVYRRTPDHRVRLTELGIQQAKMAGEELRSITGGDGRVYFYVSPYIRTLQTMLEISRVFDGDQIAGAREDARIREQEFGNLQDDRMPLSKRKRLSYGRFFFRFPDGESAADVYDRVTSFRETLRNDIDGTRFEDEDTDKLTVVIITHGITLRVLLMRWFKLSVNQFEKLKNPDNCELVVMERGLGGRFSLAVHHGEEWLRNFGFDDDMMQDQRWQATAAPQDLNKSWPTSGPSYFDDLEERINGSSGPDCVSPYDEAYVPSQGLDGTYDDAFEDAFEGKFEKIE